MMRERKKDRKKKKKGESNTESKGNVCKERQKEK